jgi:hypothetical protein
VHELPDRGQQVSREGARLGQQLVEEHGAVPRERVLHLAYQAGLMLLHRDGERCRRDQQGVHAVREEQRHPRVPQPERAPPLEQHLAGGQQRVQVAHVEVGQPRGQHAALEVGGGQRITLELGDDVQQGLGTATPFPHALPRGQKAPQRVGGDGLHLAGMPSQRRTPEPLEHLLVAVLVPFTRGQEGTLHHAPVGHELPQGKLSGRQREAQPRGGIGRAERPVRAGKAAHQVTQRVRHGLEEHGRHPRRWGDP